MVAVIGKIREAKEKQTKNTYTSLKLSVLENHVRG